MTKQMSVAVRNAMLDAYPTAIGPNAIIKLRSGTPPANCSAADSGTVISTMSLASSWMSAASAGAKAFSAMPVIDASADAKGIIGHYRIYASDGTTCHDQGTVSLSSTPWSGSTAVALGTRRNNGGNVYICSQAGTTAASGGPTGTGTAITDGSAKWDYVSAVGDMTVDNNDVQLGQQISITSWSMNLDGHA